MKRPRKKVIDAPPHMGLSPEALPHTLVCLTGIGMALAFWLADRESATSRALALALANLAVGLFLNINLLVLGEGEGLISALLAVPEAISMAAFLEWLLRVRRTVPAGKLDVRGGDNALRIGQAFCGVYLLMSFWQPQARVEHFLGAATIGLQVLERGEFWLFAAPISLVMLLGGASALLLLRRRPEKSEQLRVLACIASTPFFVSGFVLPVHAGALAVQMGLLIMLIGGVQYHVLQGQRGVFLSRFLSPQVADIVSRKGLKGAMEQANLEITVVCCDLRGFTRYAQATPSNQVLAVLSDYYARVGEVVAEVGGTIKDYAGDGILILVGAPIADAHHAAQGLKMAADIRRVGIALTEQWGTRKAKLGIGIGVASGVVTVGVIGSASRLEYTAVGSAVNLAARLCEEAADREILVAPRTAELTGGGGLSQEKPPTMKGFAKLEHIYSMP